MLKKRKKVKIKLKISTKEIPNNSNLFPTKALYISKKGRTKIEYNIILL